MAYTLIATTFVGDLLVALRSVYPQDKAIAIGFWMMWSAIFSYGPGKFLYDAIADQTCQYWGTQTSICHLHDSSKLGNYLCYLTGSLLVLCALLKIILWFLCGDLKIFDQEEKETRTGAEMQELMSNPTFATKKSVLPSETGNNGELWYKMIAIKVYRYIF